MYGHSGRPPSPHPLDLSAAVWNSQAEEDEEQNVNLSPQQLNKAFRGNKELEVRTWRHKKNPLQKKLKLSVSSTNVGGLTFQLLPLSRSLDLVFSFAPSICCLSLNFPPTPVLYCSHFWLFHSSTRPHSLFVSICRVSFNFFPLPIFSLSVRIFLLLSISPLLNWLFLVQNWEPALIKEHIKNV